jgi:thioester reductase-like protein
MPPDTTVLVTGFPERRAEQTLAAFAEAHAEARFVVLVGSSQLQQAQRKLEDLPASRRARVDVLEGSTTFMDFGLSGPEYRQLAERVSHILHLATSADSMLDAGTVERVNVVGMREILEFARATAAIRAVVVASSTFVSGDRQGLVLERELAAGQGFRSAAEETLARAELMAREQWSRLPIAIARIPRVGFAADSGELERGTALGALLAGLIGNVPATGIPTPEQGRAPVHFAPSEFVARALVALCMEPRAACACFHLTDPEPPTLRALIELVARASGRTLGMALPNRRFAKAVASMAPDEARGVRLLVEELTLQVDYDVRNTRAILPELRCPAFDTYVDAIVAAARAPGQHD